jgi:hypothetical protein
MGNLKFGKIYDDIYESSVTADPLVRLVFMDLIVLSDADGLMKQSLRSFSHTTHVPLETVKKAVAVLSEPDPESWSQAEEGRRIVPVEGKGRGLMVVNKRKYWDKRMSPEEKREAAKLRKQEQRERDKKAKIEVSAKVDDSGRPAPAHGGVVIRADGEGHFVEIRPKKIAEYRNKFPDMDVQLELEKVQNFMDLKKGNGVDMGGVHAYVANWLIRSYQKGEYTKKDPEPYKPTEADLDPHHPSHDGYIFPTGKIYSSIAGKPVEPEEYQPIEGSKGLETNSP